MQNGNNLHLFGNNFPPETKQEYHRVIREIQGKSMPKKLRPWTKEDVRTLKTLAREKTKTPAIAHKLKRTLGATYQKARALSVTLGGGRKKKR
jgi:uncharacterized protein (DUF2336 family)